MNSEIIDDAGYRAGENNLQIMGIFIVMFTTIALSAPLLARDAALEESLPEGERGPAVVLPYQEVLDRIRVVFVTAGVPAPGDALRQAAAVDVLAGAEKDRREGASLGQSLEHLPGIRTLDTGNNAGVPVIRGLTGNRIRLLSNGVGVDSQQYGIRHQPNIDPFLSERIEVVRGASSILYGSDALGGSIDVRALPLRFSESGRQNTGATKLAWY